MPHCKTIIQHLRSLGYRITPQREMIIEAVAHQNGHITAEEVYEQVHNRTQYLNIATVYRTLDLLVDVGVASRSDLANGQKTYASMLHGPHVHLVCRQCGGMINAGPEIILSLDKELREIYRFTADLQHLSLTGLCADCRSNS